MGQQQGSVCSSSLWRKSGAAETGLRSLEVMPDGVGQIPILGPGTNNARFKASGQSPGSALTTQKDEICDGLHWLHSPAEALFATGLSESTLDHDCLTESTSPSRHVQAAAAMTRYHV